MRNALFLVAILVAGSIFETQAQADEVVGAIWKIEFKDDDSTLRLQCTKDFKVFGLAGKEIGTWEGDGAKAVIKITKGAKGSKRNGTYTITQKDINPPTYRGKYKSDNGDISLITVLLVKD